MNDRTDVDQLLRGWLDEGQLTPPEAPVWAALARIETTRQRGALRVSLEERIMRMQPMATIAAVALMAIVGLAIYFGLAGGPNVGDLDPTPAPGAVQTEDFSQPMTLTPPDGWVLVEEPSSMVITRLEGSVVREQIGAFDLSQAAIWSGVADGHVPFPDDLAAWLESFPEVTEEVGPGSVEITASGATPTTVSGSPATSVDASTRFVADPQLESTLNLVFAESANLGTDALILDGQGRIRFVIFEERGVLITYHATTQEFSEDRFNGFLDSLRFVDE